jgi:tripartite-type tricarboxylate transporter receptor subunit TctC
MFKKSILLALLMAGGLAHAQDYPTRPITFVLPAPPGGPTDVVARALADEMSKTMKQPIIIDNKPGATGMLGVQSVVRAAPDGYTVLVTHSTPIYYAPYMFAKVPYDVRRDLSFVTEIASGSLVVAVTKDVPVRTMKEFVAWAAANKGKVNYGSYGVGSSSHLMSSYLSSTKNLDMNHIAYKGESLMINDMLGGQIPMAIGTLGTMAPFLASGQLRPLAVIGERRLQNLPNVPTMTEAGFPEPEYQPLAGLMMMVPINTPAPVLARLEKEARAAIQTPALKARFQAFGLVGIGNSSADFRRDFEASGPMIQRLVKVSGAKLD